MKPGHKLYFRNLDAIRSIACIYVLVSHLIWETIEGAGYLSENLRGSQAVDQFLLFFFKNGGFGVRMFFVLSGFLITTLIVREIKETGSFDIRNFYVRRILRIWPVYFVVILFCLFAYPALKQFLTGETAFMYESKWRSFLFLTNFDALRIAEHPPAYSNSMLAVTWSVSIEEQFYIAWPLLFYFLPYRFFKAAVLLILTGSLFFIFWNRENPNITYYHTFSNVIYLASGGYLALLHIEGASWIIKKGRQQEWLLLLPSVLLLLSLIWGIGFVGSAWYSVFYAINAALLLFFVLLHQLICKESVIQLGNYQPLVWMSVFTYGLYMYHRIVLWVADQAVLFLFGKQGSLLVVSLFSLGVLVLSIIVSWLSYKYFESYFLRLKERFSFFTK
jgi:peptidoglycan/LPS O-acetylase OafA/YrhL